MQTPTTKNQFSYRPIFAAIAITAAALLASSSLKASVIYYDSFSGTNGASLSGASPTTDATGATYSTTSRGSGPVTYDSSTGSPAGSAITGYNGSAVLSLATGGTFTRSAGQQFTISADISLNDVTGFGTISDPQPGAGQSGNSTRGVGLGFYVGYPTNPSGNVGYDPFGTDYTGFNLQQNGNLQFVKNGVSTGFASASFTGSFSTSAFYNLSYTVDTATGNLVSIVFNGVDLTSTFSTTTAGAFTTANTAYAGFAASSSSVANGSRVDNFTVAAVPEPSTTLLGFLGGFGLLVMLQRRRSLRLA